MGHYYQSAEPDQLHAERTQTGSDRIRPPSCLLFLISVMLQPPVSRVIQLPLSCKLLLERKICKARRLVDTPAFLITHGPGVRKHARLIHLQRDECHYLLLALLSQIKATRILKRFTVDSWRANFRNAAALSHR